MKLNKQIKGCIMTLKVRRMKKYNQRRSSKIMNAFRKDLQQCEHKIQASVSAFLACIKEGSTSKARAHCEQTRNILLKYGPEMQKIANEIGGIAPKRVSDFLASIDHILLNEFPPSDIHTWVDDGKIRSCNIASQRLEDILLK
jgi:hypothetical protein